MKIEGTFICFKGENARRDALFFAENIPGQVVWFNSYEQEKTLNGNVLSSNSNFK